MPYILHLKSKNPLNSCNDTGDIHDAFQRLKLTNQISQVKRECKKMNFQKINRSFWIFYLDADREIELLNNFGKWTYFYDASQESADFAEMICEKIVRDGVAISAKHSNEDYGGIHGFGVCYFYCNGSDIDARKKILRFMLDNNMIRKTNAGELMDISFEYDIQTGDAERDHQGETKIQLSHFVNLKTGEWLDEIILPT